MSSKFILSVLFTVSCISIIAQEKWELKKNKNSVRVWTKDAPGWSMKQYRASCLINAKAKDVFDFVTTWKERPNWYANNTQAKALHTSKDNEYIVYFVYDAPWPVQDRDIVSKAMCNQENDSTYIMRVSALPNYIPRNDEYVRIEKANGFWRITQVKPNITEVYLEGKSNTGGDVPEWIANLFVEENPFTSLENLKKHFENK